jgi:hypothetical protein
MNASSTPAPLGSATPSSVTASRRWGTRGACYKAEKQNVPLLDPTFSVQKSVTLLHTAFEAKEVRANAAGDAKPAAA